MRLLSAFISLVLLSFAPFNHAQAPDAYKSNSKYIEAMAEGKKLVAQHRYAFAIDSFKKACKIAQGKEPACLDALFNAQMADGRFKDAAATADSLAAVATNPSEKSFAESNRGFALYEQAGEKGKPEWLKAADDSMKAALVDNPKNASAHFYEGKILARQGQMDSSSAEFKTCVSCLSPKDPSYLRAQHF